MKTFRAENPGHRQALWEAAMATNKGFAPSIVINPGIILELLVHIHELERVKAAAAGVLAAQGTSGLDEAIAALRVALEGEARG